MRIGIVSIIALIVAAFTYSMLSSRPSFGSEPSKVTPKPAIDLPEPGADEHSRTAVFAGGCFWCTEGVFEQLRGVTDVTTGYAGGTKDTANYETVSTGTTGHAESVRVTYDPHVISYGRLLQVFFFDFNPTTLNFQGPDQGTQYRTAIFYANDDQKRVADAYIKQLTDAKIYDAPIVTKVEPIGEGFFPAEAHHQDYVRNHPDDGYIVQEALPKIDKLKSAFKELVGATTKPTSGQ